VCQRNDSIRAAIGRQKNVRCVDVRSFRRLRSDGHAVEFRSDADITAVLGVALEVDASPHGPFATVIMISDRRRFVFVVRSDGGLAWWTPVCAAAQLREGGLAAAACILRRSARGLSYGHTAPDSRDDETAVGE
jgi:hypothetical protein